MLKYLNTICSTLKKIFDTKFSYKLSHVDLQKVSPKQDLIDVKLEAVCNAMFLSVYTYSYGKKGRKDVKKQEKE